MNTTVSGSTRHKRQAGERRAAQADRATTLVESLASFQGPPEEFLQRLLVMQGRLAAADSGVLLRFSESQGPRVEAMYTPQHDALPPAWLDAAVQQAPKAFNAVGAVAMELADHVAAGTGPEVLILLAFPPSFSDAVVGGDRLMSAFMVRHANHNAIALARQQVELTLGVMSAYEARTLLQHQAVSYDQLSEALEIVGCVNAAERSREAAFALCNTLASRWSAHRVSLGWRHGETVKIEAISRTEKLVRKMKMVQDLEAAMEECLDQDTEVAVPAASNAISIAREHERMVREHGSRAILSSPIRAGGQVVGVITIEQEPDAAAQEITGDANAQAEHAATPVEDWNARALSLRLIADMSAPYLYRLYQADRWVGAKLARSTRRAGAVVVGPRHTWAKLTAVLVLAAGLASVLLEGRDQIEAPFEVQAVQRQLITAPFDGHLDQVLVTPGDAVVAGVTVLATLDTAELRLERSRLQSDLIKFQRQAEAARQEQRMAEVQMAYAEADAIRAQMSLLEARVDRAQLRSPLTGVVTEGDLKRAIGRRVTQGDVLFEVVPLEQLRASLQLPESRVAQVQAGMTGELAAAAQPGQHVNFTVESVQPAATTKDGSHYFAARAHFEDRPAWLRPGMNGVAKVDAGEKPYIILWTREAVDWLRMKLWI